MQVILCMVFARNAAMGFNRWADRRIDAENPRTAMTDYIKFPKIERAKVLLKSTNQTVQDIAAAL